MKINKLNYELHIVDYLEGTLDAELKVGFDDFLQKYPEIQEEINMYLAAPRISEDKTINYEYKDSLKKTTASNFKGWGVIGLLLLAITAICIGYWLKPKSYSVNEQVIEFPNLKSVDENISISKKDAMEAKVGSEPSSGDLTIVENNGQSAKTSRSENNEATETTTKALIQDENKKTRQVDPANDLKQATKSIQNTQELKLKKKELNPVFMDRVILDKEEPAKVFSIQQKDQENPKNREMVLLDRLESQIKTIAVTTPNNLSMDMAVELMDIDDVHDVTKRKRSWKDIFIPAGYRDIELNDVLASQELKTAAEEIGDAMLPLSLTK